MINKTLRRTLFAFGAVIVAASCSKKLDLNPVNDLTPDKTYATAAGYKGVLAKIYGGFASGGNQGPAGQPDISGGLDEGSQIAFIRPFFNCQELPTDEAVVAWNDQTIQDYHKLSFTASDPFLKGMYARPMYNITLANEYLRFSTDEAVASHGISGAEAAEIKTSRAEVRFLRAFNYWLMIDLFGNSTFVTEADGVAGPLPQEGKRADITKYVVGELKAIDADLAPVKTIEYGRVDQGAAWALLARIYLNDSVYTGVAHYDSAVFYASKLINDGGYSLRPDYKKLFMADNDLQKDEFIFAVPIDGLHTQGYGNTTFFVHGPSGDEATKDYGVTGGGWYGYRATSGLVNLFADKTGATDKRAMFTTSKYGTDADQLAMADITNFDNGPHVIKYVNKRADSAAIHDPTGYFADIDFPVFRLSEMYLIYAEATLRGGGGSTATAVNYINLIRARAYGGTTTGQISAADLNLQFVLDERGRELFWEGHRRTDLVRYGQLTTGAYLWPWKGGIATGTSVDAKYNLFPIPVSVLSSNSNLTQNPGF